MPSGAFKKMSFCCIRGRGQPLLRAQDKAEQSGSTAIQVAAANGQLEVVECLLKAKADLQKPDSWQKKNTRDAFGEGMKTGVVHRILGEKKIYNAIYKALYNDLVSAKDRFGISPLQIAAQRGHLEVVKRLMEAKASLEQKDLEGHGVSPGVCGFLQ